MWARRYQLPEFSACHHQPGRDRRPERPIPTSRSDPESEPTMWRNFDTPYWMMPTVGGEDLTSTDCSPAPDAGQDPIRAGHGPRSDTTEHQPATGRRANPVAPRSSEVANECQVHDDRDSTRDPRPPAARRCSVANRALSWRLRLRPNREQQPPRASADLRTSPLVRVAGSDRPRWPGRFLAGARA